MAEVDPAELMSLAEKVAMLPKAERERVLDGVQDDALKYDWRFWGRPKQLKIVDEEFSLAIIKAGRGMGKSRAGCEWAREKARQNPGSRGALVARTSADVRDVLVQGESGVLNVCPPSELPLYEPSKRLLTWPNGTTALCFSSETPDQLRGPEFDWALADEVACLPAGTLIVTERGLVSIEKVCVGTRVRTRSGWNRVLWSGPTRANAELMEISTANGTRLRATPDHLIWTQRGWTRVDKLVAGDTLSVCEPMTSGASDGMTSTGTATRKTDTFETAKESFSTAKCGQSIAAKSLMGMSSTTKTMTATTTTWSISSSSKREITPDITLLMKEKAGNAGGMKQQVNALVNAQLNFGRTLSFVRSSVPSAGSQLSRQGYALSSVDKTVGASSVVVSVKKLSGREQTYDLSVENEHEFYANGLLVHNSWKFIPDDSGLNAWNNLRIATRHGAHPQIVAMTTPKRTAFMKELLAEEDKPGVLVIHGSTRENQSNLSAVYLQTIYGLYEGTALALQELEGMMLDDIEGALLTMEVFDENRVNAVPPNARLTVVGVDPSVAERPKDQCGIVVVTSTMEPELYKRHAYVLEDATVHGSPSVWAKQVVDVARKWGAPVIAEVNQGAALVRMTLETVDPTVRVLEVRAHQGKAIRAEPVVSAYQQGRVSHVGELTEYEDEFSTWIPDVSTKSPDRVDAAVWALSSLLVAQPKGLYTPPIRARSAAKHRVNTSRGSNFLTRGARTALRRR